MRILIAEDDVAARLIIQAVVRALGHACVVATDGEEAWRLFQATDVDVVISDRRMPGLDGVELCRRVRAAPRDTYTYFIFLTVVDDKAAVAGGMAAGADDYLVKPLDADELRTRLAVADRVTTLHRQLARQSAELERLNRALFAQSRADALTGLGSRLKLREDLEAIAARARRYGHGYCVVMCDVDFFKAYNDGHGHLAGDEVLRTVARTLRATCRGGDHAYRYGGEEFLILLPEQSLDGGFAAAERHRRAIEALAIPHPGNPCGGVVTISAGVAALPNTSTAPIDTWLAAADAALYRAKHSGRNRVAVDGDDAPLVPAVPEDGRDDAGAAAPAAPSAEGEGR